MKSLLLLGLSSLAANVKAHGYRREPGDPSSSMRKVDISQFLLADNSSYTGSVDTSVDEPVESLEKRGDYIAIATDRVKTAAPHAQFRLVDHYISRNGIGHAYFKQTMHSIDIDNSDFNVNVGKDGQIISYGNSFFQGDAPTDPLVKRAFSEPVVAFKGAIDTLGLSISTTDTVRAEAGEGKESFVFKGTNGTIGDPKAKLVYFHDGGLALAWRVETYTGNNWLLTYIDAETPNKVYGVVDYVSNLATYQVYPWGVKDPSEGERRIVEDPWNIEASPFTWLSDGETNYTTTRGNNGIAQTDPDGDNTLADPDLNNQYINFHRPNNDNLKFEYPYSPADFFKDDYRDASVTQLFYTVNKYHDLLYALGFDEQAGNFQTNNQGKGGLEDDEVIISAQDGFIRDNAYFSAPPDGEKPRMGTAMYYSTMPNRDAAFDASIVIHEYTHGLSNRLTGGPGNSQCLSGHESGGLDEGWSDFMAAAVLVKSTDSRATNFAVGSWATDRPSGVRNYPYSTDGTACPYRYGHVAREQDRHEVGAVWAAILYEVLWNLIDKHGITNKEFPEFDAAGVPTDGRFLAMKLVMVGMSLQPCGPSFVQARDAILDADRVLTGGANQCELWTAFARRGLGRNARANSATSVRESFSKPKSACKA